MPPRPQQQSLGAQELELLRHLTEQEQGTPRTVGEVAEAYGAPRGLSRSTVVTVMERLRAKGYLEREKGPDGVFRYAPAAAQEEVMGGLIDRFIERTLSGSLTPLAAYFGRRKRLSPDEQRQLESLLAKLEEKDAAEGGEGDAL
jgi:predicted transcriptional regulator